MARPKFEMRLETSEDTNLGLPAVAGNWGVAADGIWFLDVLRRARDGQTTLQWFSFAARKLSQRAVLPRVMGGTTPEFSVTPNGRWVAWTQRDHQDSDLMLIENFC